MREYYFIVSLLPQLEIGHIPSLGFPELMDLLAINLSENDLEKVRKFLRLIDIENMRAFWSGEPFDRRGNVNRSAMEQALTDQAWPNGEEFPIYLKDYLNKYTSVEGRLYHFPFLLNQFFLYEAEEESGFLKDYFNFQREMRLVMVGFRAKKLHKDLSKELQYEDSTDPLVAQILAQKDTKIYEPPFEYKELRPIFEEYGDSPFELNKAIYEYQFNAIRDIERGETFGIDRILNYMARLLLVERWLELDVQEGMQVIDTIEKEIR